MPRIGAPELIIILVIVVIVFGVGKVSDVGGGLGKGIREFRRSLAGEDDDDESRETDETDGDKKKKIV